ncbi:nuclear transport factor 2 family protein [Skeletonema marinoi]|uniref:Nuclear transport factor 2 family protein n=1 Tax=Skeletonema marinoi TaxID=267567 RepID=A0AAD9D7C7_9STRA|nr:nuclear transport factor 2 family protein [Skeletonema marinoi]
MERARQLQAEIDQLHVDDCGAVLLANLAFYEAFSSRDAEWMNNVWWSSPSVICIHPSHSPLIGSNAIVDSFSKMFENGIKNTSRVRGGKSTAGSFMTPTNIRALSVRGTTASLVCDEEVYAKGLQVKVNETWKMVHRHASWHPETAAARDAMKAEPGIILYDEGKDANGASSGTSKQGMTLRKVNSEGSTSKRPAKSPSIPQSLEGLDANAVLGIPLPKEEPKKSTSSDESALGKIINLNDLLGGGESNTGDDSEKGLGDVLADLFGDSADSDSKTVSGKGTPDDPFITRRVIKIGPEGIEKGAKHDETKSDGDDEEPKNVTIDLRGKSEEERKRVLSELVDGVLNDALPGMNDAMAEFDSSGEEVGESDPIDVSVSTTSTDDKENLRQRCIATLRKLSESGMISGKQKRVLLTDIITSSARGETSLIETAYELLCADEDVAEEDTEGMEDFTEQCRVFAEVERD